jgi:hypothetical protein
MVSAYFYYLCNFPIVFENNEALRASDHIPDLILSKKFTRIYAEIIAETYNNDMFEPKQTRQLTPKDQLARMRSTRVSVSLEAHVFFQRNTP